MRFGPEFKLAFALVLAWSTAALGEPPRAQYLGSFTWEMDQKWFGGWSGLELSMNGSDMTVITDRARVMTAQITRKGDQISAIEPGRSTRLRASTGKLLVGRIVDSEGLALAPEGGFYVSFEGVARVAHYDRPGATPTPLQRPAAFGALPKNRALEALAIDRNGQLYAIPEDIDGQGRISVHVWNGTGWALPFQLDGGQGFLPVGADFGPDGWFYLLERGWNLFGFRSRLRRWQISDGQPEQEELLLQSPTGTHDNLEGVSIWRDQQGRTRITMIADDNFLFFQRTELVDYVIPP